MTGSWTRGTVHLSFILSQGQSKIYESAWDSLQVKKKEISECLRGVWVSDSNFCFFELAYEGAQFTAIKKKDASLKQFHLFGWNFSLRISISRQTLGRIIGSWGPIMHISFSKSFILSYKDEPWYTGSLCLERVFAQAWWLNVCQQGFFAPG